VKWWVPGTLPFSGTKSKAEYMGIVKRIQEGFPNGFKLNVTHMIGEDNIVAAEAESVGQHKNGMAYNNHYHFLFTLGKDGKITGVKEYMDTQHLAAVLAGPKH
jgi:ketosteroid isomerase-like protein